MIDRIQAEGIVQLEGQTFTKKDIAHLERMIRREVKNANTLNDMEKTMATQPTGYVGCEVEEALMDLVKKIPQVQDALDLLDEFHLYMREGFLDEFKAKLNPGVWDDKMAKIERVLKDLKPSPTRKYINN